MRSPLTSSRTTNGRVTGGGAGSAERVAQAPEQAAVRPSRFLASQVGEAAQQLLLLRGQRPRYLERDLHDEVAADEPGAADLEHVTVLRAGRHVDRERRAVERGHLDRAAERRLHERDGDGAPQVTPVAL